MTHRREWPSFVARVLNLRHMDGSGPRRIKFSVGIADTIKDNQALVK